MFKDINGFEGKYSISHDGQVYSYIKNRFLKGSINGDGYLYVQFNNKKVYSIHRLVALTFIENIDKNKYNIVDHIDGNKLNNHYLNLRWGDLRINGRNKNNKLNIENSVGIKGIRPDNNSWRAEWYDDENNYGSKSYSISKYGYTKALQLAIKARWEAEDKFYN